MTNGIIAVSGSPNSITDISVDIQEDFLNSPLLGALVSLNLTVQHGKETQHIVVLGQVSDLKTENRWHEDQRLKNYIKKRGALPNLTQVGDITTGKVQIIGAYAADNGCYRKTRLSIPPGSGIPVMLADRSTVERIMAAEEHVAYIGKFYGTHNVPAPVYVRHFGDFDSGGNGEAYMGGVFGPSGSGKSVQAATLLALWAKNPTMGMLILDPQSEFASNRFSKGQEFRFDFHQMLETTTNGKFCRSKHVVSIDKIKLEGIPLFVALLNKKKFFGTLGLGDGKKDDAMENLVDALERLSNTPGTNRFTLNEYIADTETGRPELYEQLVDEILQACADAYAASSRTTKFNALSGIWSDKKETLHQRWDDVVNLFKSEDRYGNQRTDLTRLVGDVMTKGSKYILDLDPERLRLDDDFKLHIMQFVFKRISEAAHKNYKRDGDTNCLVVIDEAGRFIPQHTENGLKKRMAEYISGKVKELRKFRVGFQFITQNITEIQKDIFRNLHYRIYGVGLSIGADVEHIKGREGDESFDMYKTLPDPRLSKTYSYMVCGAILALGTTGKPMTIVGLGSDREILECNGYGATQQPILATPPLPPTTVVTSGIDAPF